VRGHIREVGKVLGLLLEDPEEYLKDKEREVRKPGWMWKRWSG